MTGFVIANEVKQSMFLEVPKFKNLIVGVKMTPTFLPKAKL